MSYVIIAAAAAVMLAGLLWTMHRESVPRSPYAPRHSAGPRTGDEAGAAAAHWLAELGHAGHLRGPHCTALLADPAESGPPWEASTRADLPAVPGQAPAVPDVWGGKTPAQLAAELAAEHLRAQR